MTSCSWIMPACTREKESKKQSQRAVQRCSTFQPIVQTSTPSNSSLPNSNPSCARSPPILSKASHSKSTACARPSSLASTRSHVQNAPHISPIRGMGNLNGKCSRSVDMFNKFVLLAAAAFTALSLLPQPVSAQGKKDSVVMGMTLEPPGLDPTAGAAAAIGEVTLYNVYETLTKVKEDGSVGPLLAESWEIAPDLKTYTFKLRKGVKFQNGEPFNAEAVKFSYERAAAATSTNKDKSLFLTIAQIG